MEYAYRQFQQRRMLLSQAEQFQARSLSRVEVLLETLPNVWVHC